MPGERKIVSMPNLWVKSLDEVRPYRDALNRIFRDMVIAIERMAERAFVWAADDCSIDIPETRERLKEMQAAISRADMFLDDVEAFQKEVAKAFPPEPNEGIAKVLAEIAAFNAGEMSE